MNKSFLFVFVIIILCCSNIVQEDTNYENLTFISTDSIKIEGRLWFSNEDNSNLLVIDVNPCLVTTLPPDSSKEERYDLLLRQKLIDSGAYFFEFTGRKDSVLKYDRKYPSSTMFTKAEDLENAIKYLKSREDTKSREIILIGQSEGGMTSALVASENDVKGLVLISTPAVYGKEFMEYQRLCEDSLFMGTVGLHPKAFEQINNLSSLDQKYGKSIEGFHQFRKDSYGPLRDIVLLHDNYDTIAVRITKHLKLRWDREDSITKKLHSNNFTKYCKAYKHFAYIQPEQIALYKWNPHLFFPQIKCPVLAVYGDQDKKLEYSSSLLNMEKMLLQGGNTSFTPLVLNGYNHYLENNKKQINKEVVEIISNWIMNQ